MIIRVGNIGLQGGLMVTGRIAVFGAVLRIIFLEKGVGRASVVGELRTLATVVVAERSNAETDAAETGGDAIGTEVVARAACGSGVPTSGIARLVL